jgi:hypothetical protein
MTAPNFKSGDLNFSPLLVASAKPTTSRLAAAVGYATVVFLCACILTVALALVAAVVLGVVALARFVL